MNYEIKLSPVLLKQFIERFSKEYNLTINEATEKVLNSNTFKKMQSKTTTLSTYQPNDLIDYYKRHK